MARINAKKVNLAFLHRRRSRRMERSVAKTRKNRFAGILVRQTQCLDEGPNETQSSRPTKLAGPAEVDRFQGRTRSEDMTTAVRWLGRSNLKKKPTAKVDVRYSALFFDRAPFRLRCFHVADPRKLNRWHRPSGPFQASRFRV